MSQFKSVEYRTILHYWDDYGLERAKRRKTRATYLEKDFKADMTQLSFKKADQAGRREAAKYLFEIEFNVFIETLTRFKTSYPHNNGDVLPHGFFDFWDKKNRFILVSEPKMATFINAMITLITDLKLSLAHKLVDTSFDPALIVCELVKQGYEIAPPRPESPRFRTRKTVKDVPDKMDTSDSEQEESSSSDTEAGSSAGAGAGAGSKGKAPPKIRIPRRKRPFKRKPGGKSPKNDTPSTNHLKPRKSKSSPKKPSPKGQKGENPSKKPKHKKPKTQEAKTPHDVTSSDTESEHTPSPKPKAPKNKKPSGKPATPKPRDIRPISQIEHHIKTDLSEYKDQEYILLSRGEHCLRVWDIDGSTTTKAERVTGLRESREVLLPATSPAIQSGKTPDSISGWYTALKSTGACEKNGFCFPTQAHAEHTFFSNDYPQFSEHHKESLLKGYNPWVCFAESDPYHGLRYGYGQKWAADVKELRLRPRYGYNGKPENPHAGILTIAIANRETLDTMPHMHILAEYALRRMNTGSRIVYERETSFLNTGPKNIYKEVLTWPDFSQKWHKQCSLDFGLNEKTWKTFKQEFRRTKPSTPARKSLKNMLAERIIQHRKKCIRQRLSANLAKVNAKQKHRASYKVWTDKMPPAHFFKLVRFLINQETIYTDFHPELISDTWFNVLFRAKREDVMDYVEHLLTTHPDLKTKDPEFLGQVADKLESLLKLKKDTPEVWKNWIQWQDECMTHRAFNLFHKHKATLKTIQESTDIADDLGKLALGKLTDILWLLNHNIHAFIAEEDSALLVDIAGHTGLIHSTMKEKRKSVSTAPRGTHKTQFQLKPITAEEIDEDPPTFGTEELVALPARTNPDANKNHFFTLIQTGNVLGVKKVISPYKDDKKAAEQFLKDTKDAKGNSAFHLLAKNYDRDMFDAIWPFKTRAKLQTAFTNNDEQLPLHIAAQYGQVDFIQKALVGDTTPNKQDKNKYTALHFACQHGHLEAAEHLILKEYAHLTYLVTHEGSEKLACELVPEDQKPDFNGIIMITEFQQQLEQFIRTYETVGRLTETTSNQLQKIIINIQKIKDDLPGNYFEHIKALSNRVSSNRSERRHYTLNYILCREKQSQFIKQLTQLRFAFNELYQTRYVDTKDTSTIRHAFSPFALSVVQGDKKSIKAMVKYNSKHLLELPPTLKAQYPTASALASHFRHPDLAKYLARKEKKASGAKDTISNAGAGAGAGAGAH